MERRFKQSTRPAAVRATLENEKMTSLYILAAEYRVLLDTLTDGDFDATTIADTIEASNLPDDLSAKAQNVEYAARNIEADIPAIDAEIERLQARKAGKLKTAQGLRDYLLACMQSADLQKIETPMFSFSQRKNPPAVVLEDEKLLPAEYWRTPEPKPPVSAPDKAAIKAACLVGQDVPGAKLVQGIKLSVK